MKSKIITITFISFILFFSIFHIIENDQYISKTERRKLTSLPIFELNSEYIKKLEKYLLDQFPYRDNFRNIKATFNYKVLNRLDNNGIYLKDNYIFKSNYPTNKKSVKKFIEKTNKLQSLLTKNNKSYMLIVPDKNFYLNDSNFLQIDYEYIYNELNDVNAIKIDIRDIMGIEDYYETDTHWKQENLHKVIYRLSEKMDFKYKDLEYKENKYNRFYGVYYGESAMKRPPEEITYLTNHYINSATVNYLENNKLTSVYNKEKLYGMDAYEVYLDGASSYIEINNDKLKEKKELVVFRDSFGSSLIPLLIPYYSKITIIDNRYINSDYFLNYIEFTNQDVLFLYSTLIVNESSTLKG